MSTSTRDTVRASESSPAAALRLESWLNRAFEPESAMATTTKKSGTARGRAQERPRVAGTQEHEVRYEAKKTGATAADVKRAVKSVGNSRKKVDSELKK